MQGGDGAAADLTERGMATKPVRPDKAALIVPGDLVVTRVDAEKSLGKEQIQAVDDLTGTWYDVVWRVRDVIVTRTGGGGEEQKDGFNRNSSLSLSLPSCHATPLLDSQPWRCGFCMKEQLGPPSTLL